MQMFNQFGIQPPRLYSESTASKVYEKLLELFPYLKDQFFGTFKEEFIILLATIIENNLDYKQYQSLDDATKNKIREILAIDLYECMVINIVLKKDPLAPISNLEGYVSLDIRAVGQVYGGWMLYRLIGRSNDVHFNRSAAQPNSRWEYESGILGILIADCFKLVELQPAFNKINQFFNKQVTRDDNEIDTAKKIINDPQFKELPEILITIPTELSVDIEKSKAEQEDNVKIPNVPTESQIREKSSEGIQKPESAKDKGRTELPVISNEIPIIYSDSVVASKILVDYCLIENINVAEYVKLHILHPAIQFFLYQHDHAVKKEGSFKEEITYLTIIILTNINYPLFQKMTRYTKELVMAELAHAICEDMQALVQSSDAHEINFLNYFKNHNLWNKLKIAFAKCNKDMTEMAAEIQRLQFKFEIDQRCDVLETARKTYTALLLMFQCESLHILFKLLKFSHKINKTPEDGFGWFIKDLIKQPGGLASYIKKLIEHEKKQVKQDDSLKIYIENANVLAKVIINNLDYALYQKATNQEKERFRKMIIKAIKEDMILLFQQPERRKLLLVQKEYPAQFACFQTLLNNKEYWQNLKTVFSTINVQLSSILPEQHPSVESRKHGITT